MRHQIKENTMTNTATAIRRILPRVITKNANARSICELRWAGKGNAPKIDPCDGCQLYRPCIKGGSGWQGMEAFQKWVESINDLADSIAVNQ